MSNPEIIEHPEKIGVGTYPSGGLHRMITDLDTVDASWFYTWTPTLPAMSFASWTLGLAVSDGGAAGDHELKLGKGSDAWAVQDAPVTAGARYSLRFDGAGVGAGQGGVMLNFLDAGGKLLKSDFVAVSGGQREYTLTGAAAPAGAASCQILAYTGSSDGIEIDNISLLSNGRERLANGDFEKFIDLSSSAGSDFVPMIWSGRDMPALADVSKFSASDVLLGFNEPDHHEQANMSVTQALDLWPQLMATGKRLGSPATTTPGTLGQGSWLDSFMKGAAARNYKVDFVAVHYYSADPSIAAFKSFLEKVHTTYGKPVWVTEWALVDWGNLGRFSFAETAKFMAEATQMMDDLDFVEKHAWFATYAGLDALDMHTNLFDAAGQLTEPGRTFDKLASSPSGAGTAPPGTTTPGTTTPPVTTKDVINTALASYTLPDGAYKLVYTGSGEFSGTGNSLDNEIVGGPGRDVLRGAAGHDRIDGGRNEDMLYGGAGNDKLVGGANFDQLYGEDGSDELIGDTATINQNGAGANDLLVGGAGNDALYGDAKTILVKGRGVKDYLFGGDGHDALYGDAETMTGNSVGGSDMLDGGAGDDWLYGDARVADAGVIGGADRLTGGAGNDQLFGGGGNDVFVFGSGGTGQDVIHDFSRAAGNRDIIDLKGFKTSFAALGISHVGGDVVIGLPGGVDSIKLIGVHSVTAADFAF